MATTTTITASRFGGTEMDDTTLRAYGLSENDIGKYAVIQHGCACLGIGNTREQALADASRACGSDVQPDDDPRFYGGVEVVEIEEAQ
jgi:hypothetical protein